MDRGLNIGAKRQVQYQAIRVFISLSACLWACDLKANIGVSLSCSSMDYIYKISMENEIFVSKYYATSASSSSMEWIYRIFRKGEISALYSCGWNHLFSLAKYKKCKRSCCSKGHKWSLLQKNKQFQSIVVSHDHKRKKYWPLSLKALWKLLEPFCRSCQKGVGKIQQANFLE